MPKEIVIYSKPGCGECLFTKKFLERSQVAFTERNVMENAEWLAEVKALGFHSLPVVAVDGQEPFHGYQPERLEQLVS